MIDVKRTITQQNYFYYEELLEYEPGKFINPDCCF